MKGHAVAGHFIDGAKGKIFVLRRVPESAARGCVLVVPPFAEEMNKCRRMVTETTMRLAAAGFATVVPDLYGTGDSAGDFSDADCETWRSDLQRCFEWSAGQDLPVSGVLGIRLGCGLLAQLAACGLLPSVGQSVLWQPVFDGSRALQQFLRLRLAAGMTDERNESLAELRQRLQRNETLEVAGYEVSGRLAAGLGEMTPPDCLPAALGRVTWLEIVRSPHGELSGLAVRLIDRTRAEQIPVEVKKCVGEPFWASTEIVTNQDVVEATVPALSVVAPPGM